MTSYVLNLFAPEYNTIGLSVFLHGTKHYVLGGPFGPRLPYNLKLVPSYGWYWSDGGAGAYIIGRHQGREISTDGSDPKSVTSTTQENSNA
jgi:hypothetical protein